MTWSHGFIFLQHFSGVRNCSRNKPPLSSNPHWYQRCRSARDLGLMLRGNFAGYDFGRHPLRAFHVGNASTFDHHLRAVCGMEPLFESTTSKHLSPQDFSVASEFIALVSPVLRVRGTQITRLLRPAPNIGKDVFSSQGCLPSFRKQLHDVDIQNGKVKHLEAVCKTCDEVLQHPGWDVHWNAPRGLDYNGADQGLLDRIHVAREWATSIICCNPIFDHLVTTHISALFELKKEKLASYHPASPLMRVFFEGALPKVVGELVGLQVGYTDEFITDLWLLMVFRGLCWYNLHHFKFKFAPVNEQYFMSRQPIYIG